MSILINDGGINYLECCICGSFNQGFERCNCRISEEQKELSKIMGIFRKKNNNFALQEEEVIKQ